MEQKYCVALQLHFYVEFYVGSWSEKQRVQPRLYRNMAESAYMLVCVYEGEGLFGSVICYQHNPTWRKSITDSSLLLCVASLANPSLMFVMKQILAGS